MSDYPGVVGSAGGHFTMRAARTALASLTAVMLAMPAHAAEKKPNAPKIPGWVGTRNLVPAPPEGAKPATTSSVPLKAAPAGQCVALPRTRSGAPPFAPGEQLVYDIDVVGVRAGKMTFEVLQKIGRGSSAEYPVRVRAQSNTFFDKVRKVNAEIVTNLRARDLSPSRFHEDLTEGPISRTADVVFSDTDKTVDITWQSKNGAKGHHRHKYQQDALDYVGGIFKFRALNLKVGQEVCFEAYAMRRLWRVTGMVEAREQITTPAGVFNAFHFKGKAVRLGGSKLEREFHIWISDDERRLPVAAMGIIDLGPVRATLTDVVRSDFKTAGAKPGSMSW